MNAVLILRQSGIHNFEHSTANLGLADKFKGSRVYAPTISFGWKEKPILGIISLSRDAERFQSPGVEEK